VAGAPPIQISGLPGVIKPWRKLGTTFRSFKPEHGFGLNRQGTSLGLGKSPDSYFSSMKCFRRVGSHNPLDRLNYRTSPLDTTVPELPACILRFAARGSGLNFDKRLPSGLPRARRPYAIAKALGMIGIRRRNTWAEGLRSELSIYVMASRL
jgi:hypothetical protein